MEGREGVMGQGFGVRFEHSARYASVIGLFMWMALLEVVVVYGNRLSHPPPCVYWSPR